MPDDDQKTDYLKRAADARARAAGASNFVVMDDYLDIAAAWRRLAEELDKLAIARVKAAAKTAPALPYIAFKSEMPVLDRTWARLGPAPMMPVFTPAKHKRARAKA